MDIIIKGRQTGKTIELIRRSHDTGAVIVTATYQRAEFVKKLAKELGLSIPEPMCVQDIKLTPSLWQEKMMKGVRKWQTQLIYNRMVDEAMKNGKVDAFWYKLNEKE